jgi:RNA polymerase sigma-70 factor (ECF subfamily)
MSESGAREDDALVREAREGDSAAFEELVRRHHARILSLCAGMLRSREAAEDAAQEAFLKAWRGLDSFRGDSAFATWLRRLAANQCLDALRRQSRRSEDSLDDPLSAPAMMARLTEPGPERAAQARDLAERLLASLPPEQRLALVLRETQGLSYEEIAETLECSLDSVKARLRRARAALEERSRHFSEPKDV